MARPVGAAETLAVPVPPPKPREMTEAVALEASPPPGDRARTRPEPQRAGEDSRRAPARGAVREVAKQRPARGDRADQTAGRGRSPTKGQAAGDDRAAEPIPGNPRPQYPRIARSRGHQGRVLIRVAVLGNGLVGRAMVAQSSGHGSLDRAALSAVERWRFRPALRDGKAVAATLTVPVVFRLRDSG